jgi:hypothetical protein
VPCIISYAGVSSDETFLKTIPIETGFWRDSVLFCKRPLHPGCGWTLTKITERVAEIFGIEKDQVVVAGKQPDRVRARSVLAYWAIRDLGLTATEVGKYLGLSKSAVSRAATRGQKLIVDQFLSLKDYKHVISTPYPFIGV